MTITRRKAVIDKNIITLTELQIELTLPAFWQGVKDFAANVEEGFYNLFSVLIPKVCPV